MSAIYKNGIPQFVGFSDQQWNMLFSLQWYEKVILQYEKSFIVGKLRDTLNILTMI